MYGTSYICYDGNKGVGVLAIVLYGVDERVVFNVFACDALNTIDGVVLMLGIS